MRLSYKFFGAFIICIVLSNVLMVTILSIHASISFSKYVDSRIMEQLDDLTPALIKSFREHNNWKNLQEDPESFKDLVAKTLKHESMPKPFSDPPPHPDHEDIHPGDSHQFPNNMALPPPIPQDYKGDHKPRPNEIHRLLDDLSMFDSSKQWIMGRSKSIQNCTLKEIHFKGNIIGYVGLVKRRPLSKPLDIGFLKRQFKAFIIVGFCIILISALVAYILSRHLLDPIRELAQGIRDLAALKFNTQLSVRSSDELGQLASDFNTMALTLEKSESMRKQWITDISHELRTPLSILQGEVEALQDGVRPVNDDALVSLHAEVSHINNLVNDLYDLSQADCGTLSFSIKILDPLELLLKTLHIFQTRFDKQQIRVIRQMQASEGCQIRADRQRLVQMYSNILENVLRYGGKPGTLEITVQVTSKSLSLSFQDSGPGVPEEALPRLFDRLYRVDPSRSRKNGGSGLGLSICKTIAETMGGGIKAMNSPGKGLKIVVELPLSV